jgi:hypothetical protein
LCVYMPVAQSPAHYINSSKGFPSITNKLELAAAVAKLGDLVARQCEQI